MSDEMLVERVVKRLKVLEPGSVGEGGLEADARAILREVADAVEGMELDIQGHVSDHIRNAAWGGKAQVIDWLREQAAEEGARDVED